MMTLMLMMVAEITINNKEEEHNTTNMAYAINSLDLQIAIVNRILDHKSNLTNKDFCLVNLP